MIENSYFYRVSIDLNYGGSSMRIQQLLYLQKVVALGNMTEAAKELFIAHSLQRGAAPLALAKM